MQKWKEKRNSTYMRLQDVIDNRNKQDNFADSHERLGGRRKQGLWSNYDKEMGTHGLR